MNVFSVGIGMCGLDDYKWFANRRDALNYAQTGVALCDDPTTVANVSVFRVAPRRSYNLILRHLRQYGVMFERGWYSSCEHIAAVHHPLDGDEAAYLRYIQARFQHKKNP